MDRAWIDGKAVALKAAIAEAAKLLGASRFPLIAGLGADVAGTRAAIALAERLGAAIDHMHSDVLLRCPDSMREAEVMITTAADARARADYLLLVGPNAAAACADLPHVLFGQTGPEADGRLRRVGWICPDRRAGPRNIGPEAGNQRESARAQQFGSFRNGGFQRDRFAVYPRAIHAGSSIASRNWRTSG